MSYALQLHQEHKERLARLSSRAWSPPPSVQQESPPTVPAEPAVIHKEPGHGWPVDCDYAMALWVPTTTRPKGRVTMREIMDLVCRRYGVTRDQMIGPRRELPLVHPRHIIMYLAKALTPLSLPQIGNLLGGRDHTTILHGARKIAGMRGEDPNLNAILRELEGELQRGCE